MHLEKQTLEEKETRQITKESLLNAKARIESEIQRVEKKEINDHSRNLLQNLHEITASLATMQDMLNLVWKRTEHMQEELARLRTKSE